MSGPPPSAHSTREAWLEAGVAALHPLLTDAGAPLPERLHVSPGFPSRAALARRVRRTGECWPGAASADGAPHILISPLIADSVDALATLLHELIHAARPTVKHGPAFAKLARALGLVGKPTATKAGPALAERLARLVAETLGPYPHPALTAPERAPRQTTRLIKVACDVCGYTARVTRKWIDQAGEPFCPADMLPMRLNGESEKDK